MDYRGASVRVKHPIMSSSTCIGVSGYRDFDLKQVQLLYIYIYNNGCSGFGSKESAH